MPWAKPRFLNSYKAANLSEEFALDAWNKLTANAKVDTDGSEDEKQFYISESKLHIEGGKTVGQDADDKLNESSMNGWPVGGPPLSLGLTREAALAAAVEALASGKLFPLESKDVIDCARLSSVAVAIKDATTMEEMDAQAETV